MDTFQAGKAADEGCLTVILGNQENLLHHLSRPGFDQLMQLGGRLGSETCTPR